MEQKITLFVIAVQGYDQNGDPQFHVDFDVNAMPGGMMDADREAKQAYLRKHPDHGRLATAIMAVVDGTTLTGSDGKVYCIRLERAGTSEQKG